MSFKVYISGSSSSAEEWKRALEAPETELRKLTDEQKEVARRFQITEEEYARGVLAFLYGERAQKERGEKLGNTIVRILEGLGAGYKLLAVVLEGVKLRWVLRIETPKGIKSISIPLEVADDVIDSGVIEMLEGLKQRVLTGIGSSAGSSRP
jgi:hypothetical protein